MTDIPAILVAAFPPDADALLARTGALVTDDMLEQISQADYGMDAEAHLAALRPIRDARRVVAPMPWEPKEVLELMRWSRPDDPAWTPGSTGERGHIIRAFCCAALLRAAAEPANDGYFDGENQTLIHAIESALVLGLALPEAAGSFLTWRLPKLRRDDEERPFFAFGLVALALLRQPPVPSSAVEELAAFVEQAESETHASASRPVRPGGSFLEATGFTLHHAAWQALAARLRSAFPEGRRLDALARRIEGGSYQA